jgi:hypothetical protein
MVLATASSSVGEDGRWLIAEGSRKLSELMAKRLMADG